MADAVATPSVTLVTNDQKTVKVFGTVAIGASPLTYTAKGLVMDFSSIPEIQSIEAPLEVRIFSSQPAGSGATAMYVYNFNPGTDPSDGKLQIFTGAAAQSALAELSNGAIPAGVSGDVIHFVATFQRL
jgi:hypothetical protein